MTIESKKTTTILALFALAVGALASSCKSPLFGLGGQVDLEAPRSISITPSSGSYQSGDIVISGVAADVYGLNLAEVKILDKASGAVLATFATTIDGNAWTSESIDTRQFADGQYTVAVTLKDARGNSSEDRVLIGFDNRAPTVLIENPLDLSIAYNGEIHISGQAYDAISSITEVNVELFRLGETEPLFKKESTTLPKWDVVFNAADSAYGLTNESLALVVTATDEGGNKNTYHYEYQALYDLNGGQVTASQVDLLDAAADDGARIDGLEFNKLSLIGKRKDAGSPTMLKVDVDSDKPTFTFVTPGETCVDAASAERYAGGSKANGTISDDDLNGSPMLVWYRYALLSDDIEAASWNELAYQVSYGYGYEQRWSFNLPGTNGTYKIQLRAQDNQNASAGTDVYGVSGVRYVIIDDGRPLVNIDTASPVAWKLYYGKDQHIDVSGTAARVDGTIEDVEIRVGNNAWVDITGATGLGTSNVSWTAYDLSLSGLAGGSTQVQVRAMDQFGVWGTAEALIIMDVDAPHIAIGDPGAGINGSVTFRGTASDDAADAFTTILDKAYAKIDSGTYVPITGTYSWSWLVNTQGLSDGAHTLWIRVIDSAGNDVEASQGFTVLQSTDKPSVAVNNLSGTPTVGGTFIVSGTVTDDDGVSGDASAIQVRIDRESVPGTYTTQVDWTDVTAKAGSAVSSSWTYGLSLASGNYRMQVRARDLNSLVDHFGSAALPQANYWNQTGLVYFIVDNDVPVVNQSGFAPTNGSYVNGGFTLTGTVTEDKGLAAEGVRVVINGTDRGFAAVSGAAPDYSFSFAVDEAWLTGAGGSNSIRVDATDTSNPAKTGSGTVQIVFDDEPPEIIFLTPDNPSTANGIVAISGTASDDFQVASLRYAVRLAVAAAPAYPDDYDLLVDQKYAFNFSLPTAGLDEDADYRVYLVAADAAGNDMSVAPSSPAILALHVDQDSDRPVIKLSNIDPDGLDADGDPSLTTLKMSRTVFGSVSDDDGSILSLRISENGAAPEPTWHNVSLSGGTFSYSSSAGDGLKTLWFEVVDKKSKPFTTNAESSLEKPRIENGAGYIESTVSYVVDENFPDVYSTIDVDRAAPLTFDAVEALTTNMSFGGSSSGEFRLRVLAHDTSGVKSVTVEVPGAVHSPFVVTAGGAVVTHDSIAYTTYDTGLISVLSGIPNGGLNVSFKIEDNSGLVTTINRTIMVDNKVPTYTVTTPAHNEVVNGDITIKGTALDEHSGLKKVEYKLGYNSGSEAWAPVGGSIYSWEIDLTGANKSDLFAGKSVSGIDAGTETIASAAHGFTVGTVVRFSGAPLPTGILSTASYHVVYATANEFRVSSESAGSPVDISAAGAAVFVSAESSDADNDQIWEFPILIRAEDNAGNVAVTTLGDYIVKLDPGGDRPRVTVSYPDVAGKTLGGAIRIYGLATDDDAVDSVYMLLDANSNGVFDAGDDKYNGSAVDWYNGGQGVQTNGSANWYRLINDDQSLNPVSGTKTILVSVRARDIYGMYGTWTAPQSIIIDKNVPQFGSLSAISIDTDDVTGNGSEHPYSINMYVSGSTVYVRGSITDDGGITAITVEGSVTGSLAADPTWFPSTYSGAANGYEMAIPITLPAGTSGSRQLTITASDNAAEARQSVYEIRMYYDNQAPTAALNPSATPAQVVQSNGWYKIKGTAEDAGSDIDRIEVYLVRRDTSDPKTDDRIYNPGAQNTWALLSDIDFTDSYPTIRGTATARTLTSLTDAELVSNDMLIPGQKVIVGSSLRTVSAYDRTTGTLTWIGGDVPIGETAYTIRLGLQVDHKDTVESTIAAAGSVTRVAGEEKSLTDPSLAGNADIMTGDTVSIGGAYRVVSAFTKASGTIAWTGAAVALGADQAYQVFSVVNDDGDHYVEYLKQDSGVTYTWSIDLKSDALPDGPIEIHYTVFDSAGNSSHYQSTGYKIQNNGPRMAAVVLGSDLDGSSTVDEDEKQQFEYVSATAYTEARTFSFTVKDGPMYIEPVVTNGNGNLRMWMTGAYTLNDYALRTAGVILPVEIPDATLDAMTDGPQTFTMRIWDSTDETNPGTTSLDITRSATIALDYDDGVDPTAAIRPFYWNGPDDNSLYDSGDGEVNGHIEIQGVYDDSDPDVSGQISVRGVAYDDQRLTALYAYMDGFAFTGGTTKEIGSYTYTLIASFAGGVWDPVDDQWGNGWKATIVDSAIGQDGHRVSWRLDLDSARIAGVADVNRVIRVVAEDKAIRPSSPDDALNILSGTGTRPSNNSLGVAHDARIKAGQLVILGTGEEAYDARITAYSSAAGIGTIQIAEAIDVGKNDYQILLDDHNGPSYKVDVVPYIESIERSVGTMSRSRQGKYPLKTDETDVIISGFNLGNGSKAPTVSVNRTDGGASITLTTTGAGTPSYDALTISAAGLARSGYLAVTVNSVPSGNNANDNALEYNKDSSDGIASTELWTDDRYLHVWTTGGMIFDAADAVYPSMATDRAGTIYGSWITYADSKLHLASTTQQYGNERFGTYDPPEFSDLYIDQSETAPSGTTPPKHVIGFLANHYGGTGWSTDLTAGGFIGLSTPNAPDLGRTGQNDRAYPSELLYYNERLWQFQQPHAARSDGGTNDNTDRLHLAYFDTKDYTLKYSYSLDAGSAAIKRWMVIDGNGGDDAGLVNYIGLANGAGTIATTTAAGQYNAIDVDEDGLPVIVYYDIAADTLRLARATVAAPTATTNWIRQTVFPVGDSHASAGTQLAMRIDATGGVHIVCLDSDSSLIYLYAPDNAAGGGAYTFTKSVVVDGLSSVYGRPDISLNGSVPHVSYQVKGLYGIAYATRSVVAAGTVLGSPASTVTSLASAAFVDKPIRIGDTIEFGTGGGDQRQVSAYNATTGVISWSGALGAPPAIGSSVNVSSWDYEVAGASGKIVNDDRTQKTNVEAWRSAFTVAKWGDAALGYQGDQRFELIYLQPEP